MLRDSLCLLLVACLACAPASNPAAPPVDLAASTPAALDLLITGVRVFDGRRVWPSAHVGVRGGDIVSVDEARPDVPVGETLDGAGLTLLPGLIDAHAHLQSTASLRLALRFGVTTELDMFALPSLVGLLHKLERGKQGATLADFRSAGILATAPGGHGTEYGVEIPTITAPDQAQAFVDARLAEGADYLKIVYDDASAFGREIPTVSRDTMAALIAAAHARGKLAVVHVSSLREATAAIEAGADGLAHIFFDTPPTPAFIELAATRKVFVADTLPVIFSLCDGGRGPALLADRSLAPLIGPSEARALKSSYRAGSTRSPRCEPALQAVRELHAAGVDLLASTDASNPGTAHGVSMHDELELLVRAGLTPLAALTAATSAPARRFGLADRGALAPGKRADLFLVRGDPTVDIHATRDIVGVWKRGVRLDLAAQLESVRQEHAALAALRAVPAPAGAESGRISDFEAGAAAAEFGAGWQPSTDAMIGGESTVELTIVRPGAARSKHALRIAGAVAPGSGPGQWAGAMFFASAPAMQPANLGRFRQVRFSARAAAPGKLAVLLFTAQGGGVPGRAEVEVSARWTSHTVTFAALGVTDPYDVQGLFFGATTPGPFTLELDAVQLE